MPTRAEIKQTLNAIHQEIASDRTPWSGSTIQLLSELFRQMRLEALAASTPADPILTLSAFYSVLLSRSQQDGAVSDIAQDILLGAFPQQLDKLRDLAQNNDPRIDTLIDEMIAQFP